MLGPTHRRTKPRFAGGLFCELPVTIIVCRALESLVIVRVLQLSFCYQARGTTRAGAGLVLLLLSKAIFHVTTRHKCSS